MIEFCGELSSECKQYMIKNETKNAFIGALIVSVLFSIIIIILAFLWEWIAILFIIIPILLVIFQIIPHTKKSLSLMIGLIVPKKLNISEGLIDIECERQSEIRSMSNVKKVLDLGEWYHIQFYFPKSAHFVCQKDLITKGTIEEFEKLFEGKIVRKEL